ncbi:MAG: hypothetical protein A2Y93_07415 [Chloroflexi bacterium RBG_13_68_17]|nr:MAG: hypothetical protein A2Y93_07415 [Chloroflexi bacterium RBG_13_68_17]
MSPDSYGRLAEHLNALPNGFPPTESGVERQLLAKIFTPEEAELASHLRLTLESPAEIAARLSADPQELAPRLKALARRGVIAVSRTEAGLAYGALPFVFGIYESQIGVIDRELARMFEDYYQQSFGRMLAVQPPLHRVIPIEESVQAGIEIRPYESAAEMLDQAKAWGVLDCICRTQKALIGEACHHPVDVCLALSQTPNAFDRNPVVRGLTHEAALGVLRRAAEAGLVHSVNNTQRDVVYVCNCCTCSCGILRGIADLGIANAVARSAFVNRVVEEACVGCELCLDRCQFNALFLDRIIQIDETRCVGCGACALACPEDALHLVRRDEADVLPPPRDQSEWRRERAQTRGLDLAAVL